MLFQTETLLTGPRFLMSMIPLVILAATIIWLRLPLFQAGLLSFFAALLTAFFFLGAYPYLLLYTLGKGATFTVYIALFLVSAMLFFHVVAELGVTDAMGKQLLFLADRPLLQVLVLAWCFGGFIEGIVGFAIPVILVSPLLIAGGIAPFKAVVLTLVGHAWAVTYGTLGVAMFILSLSSRIPIGDLAFWIAVQIGLAFLLSGFAVAHIYGGWRAVRDGVPYILAASAVTISVFFVLTAAGLPQLSALVGGIAGAVTLVAVDTIWCRGMARESHTARRGEVTHTYPAVFTFAPYLFLCIAVLLFQIQPLRTVLSGVSIAFSFPAATTAIGYAVPQEPNFVQISLRHPGFAIFLTSLFSYLLMRLGGYYRQAFPLVLLKTVYRRAASTTVTLFFLVTTAMVMNDTGMTTILAMGISRVTASFYPVLAPFIGVFGTFLTGSNTNSNLLFGLFQHRAAVNLEILPGLLAASHSAAAAIASSIAPAKILIATSAIGLKGKEHSLLITTLPYCLLIVLAIGIAAFILA